MNMLYFVAPRVSFFKFTGNPFHISPIYTGLLNLSACKYVPFVKDNGEYFKYAVLTPVVLVIKMRERLGKKRSIPTAARSHF